MQQNNTSKLSFFIDWEDMSYFVLINGKTLMSEKDYSLQI